MSPYDRIKVLLITWLSSSLCYGMPSHDSLQLSEELSNTEDNNINYAGLSDAIDYVAKELNKATKLLYQEEVVEVVEHSEKEEQGLRYNLKLRVAETNCAKDNSSCQISAKTLLQEKRTRDTVQANGKELFVSRRSYLKIGQSRTESFVSGRSHVKLGPFTASLASPLKLGSVIRIKGSVPPSSYPIVFFSLRNSKAQPLVISLRLNDKEPVHLCTDSYYIYSNELKYSQTFNLDKPLDIVIVCQEKKFEISIAGVKYEFNHSLPYESATHIYGYGLVNVTETSGLGPLRQGKRFDKPMVTPFSMPFSDLPLRPLQRMITVSGFIPADSKGFIIVLGSDPDPHKTQATALWLKFVSDKVTLNNYFNGWGKEVGWSAQNIRKGMPFSVDIVLDLRKFAITFIGSRSHMHFDYRVPLNIVTHIGVTGDVNVDLIEGLNGVRECSAEVWSRPWRNEMWLKDLECSANRTFHNF